MRFEQSSKFYWDLILLIVFDIINIISIIKDNSVLLISISLFNFSILYFKLYLSNLSNSCYNLQSIPII